MLHNIEFTIFESEVAGTWNNKNNVLCPLTEPGKVTVSGLFRYMQNCDFVN